MEEKKSLRKNVLALRNNMKKTEVEKLSRKICEKLLSSKIYENSQSVFCYYAVRNEVDLTYFIRKALSDGKTVSLPRVINKDGLMKFYAIKNLNELKPGNYGIFEPEMNNEQTDADLILVPGVVFSETGDRIGQAGGFYDRYLTEHNIYSVGVCYNYQIYKSIPSEKHDIKMNRVVSEKKAIYIN